MSIFRNKWFYVILGLGLFILVCLYIEKAHKHQEEMRAKAHPAKSAA